MPCYDPGWPPTEEEKRATELKAKLPAMLCGIISAIGLDYIQDVVEWEETGVTFEDVREWWTKHQEEDQKRNK